MCAAALFCLLAAGQAQATPITKADYKLQKDHIEKVHDAETEKCKSLMGNKRNVCMAEADAKQESGKADLEAAYKDTTQAHLNAAKVRAKTDFKVAKERCDDQAGDAKSLCVTQAEAARDKALADIEEKKDNHDALKKIGEAHSEAGKKKMESNYEVEMKRCDSYAGDAKDACQDRAKRLYHKD
jgi:hypothetical protein